MAYSTENADIMRADLGIAPGLSEKKMFGGLCFMLHGNMVCGVMKDHAMYRVGKPREAQALVAGAEPFALTGRKMGGMVQLDDGAFTDDATRCALTDLALAHANSLPAKERA
ncbi:TfoX/Sxy family protein [Chachezhania antarctica]|uniref:TfoX/Sxy family protein n=1 Tax=Chachezhania antarctica TaxID=2340860 RepID=UPI000EB3C466|nr:TfoX/Sxy family protein [Chachezhania antarctica]|tara:strand:- start:2299 stop:2634 length:336 start_codon:yes stop_codon:yes gene_type:complete